MKGKLTVIYTVLFEKEIKGSDEGEIQDQLGILGNALSDQGMNIVDKQFLHYADKICNMEHPKFSLEKSIIVK